MGSYLNLAEGFGSNTVRFMFDDALTGKKAWFNITWHGSI